MNVSLSVCPCICQQLYTLLLVKAELNQHLWNTHTQKKAPSHFHPHSNQSTNAADANSQKLIEKSVISINSSRWMTKLGLHSVKKPRYSSTESQGRAGRAWAHCSRRKKGATRSRTAHLSSHKDQLHLGTALGRGSGGSVQGRGAGFLSFFKVYTH